MSDAKECLSTVLLIDGSHVDRLRTKLGRSIDFDKLREYFSTPDQSATTIYYRDARDTDESLRLQRFFEWLARHDIEVRGSAYFSEPWYQRERYGSNLVELAVDAIDAAKAGASLAFVAGDAKLVPLFKRLDDMGVSITLISSLSVPSSIMPPPPLIDLATVFIDLDIDARFILEADSSLLLAKPFLRRCSMTTSFPGCKKCASARNRAGKRMDPVQARVALPAADPPDNLNC